MSMLKSYHGNARTSANVRQAIRQSPDSLRVLAARYGINTKTVAKWKKRPVPDDLSSGPKKASRAVLSAEEEEIIVGFRQKTLLPLDDCLYALQARIPGLRRSTLHRCLVHHGISRLPVGVRARRGKRRDTQILTGYLDIGARTTMSDGVPFDVFVAMDRASKFVFVGIAAFADEEAAQSFLRKVASDAPFTVRLVQIPATCPFAENGDRSGVSELCSMMGIEMRVAPPAELEPWSSLDALDLARENTAPTEAFAVFEARLQEFVHAYNYLRRLKALGGMTPFECLRAHSASACTIR
jgi:hypothetical protein